MLFTCLTGMPSNSLIGFKTLTLTDVIWQLTVVWFDFQRMQEELYKISDVKKNYELFITVKI